MPTRNSVKNYAPNSFYHVYNRGVEKRDIFLDKLDYHVFLNLLKIYLSPLPEAKNQLNDLFPDKRNRLRKTFLDEIEVHAFCIMPNHFHLLLYQNTETAMTEFMRSLSTSYAMHFNKRHKRVGSLFQGVYKAAIVVQDEYLLHLSRYIHRNPLKLTGWNPVTLERYPYSSLSSYLSQSHRPWITTKQVLSYFSSTPNPTLSYKQFVEMSEEEPSELGHLIIEDEEE